METEPEQQKQPYKPGIGIRLTCWFDIFLTALLFIYIAAPGSDIFRVAILGGPLGLFQTGMYLFQPDPLSHLTAIEAILGISSLIFYPLHLVLTLILKSTRTFYSLMALLIVALIISGIGAVKVPIWDMWRHNGFHAISPELQKHVR